MKIARILAAAAVLLAGACSDGTTPGSGRTQVLLTDAPFPFGGISRVDVYIAKIEATTSTDTTGNIDAGWVTIAEPMKTYNLLELQQGTTAIAGEVDLPAGQYRAIRLTVDCGQSSITRTDGSHAFVQWPVQGELKLNALVENALEVPQGGAQIVIDFDVGRTFLDNGAGGFWFIPWIRAVNNAETGSVAGTVTATDIEGHPAGVGDAIVMAWHAGPGIAGSIAATTRTDADGHYVLGWLHAGEYNVGVQPPQGFVYNQGGTPVTIHTGQRATTNFTVTPGTGGGTDTTTTGGGGGGQPTGPVATVALQPATQTVSVGDSVPVMAILKNAAGDQLAGRTVTWTISDSSKVAVFGSFGQWAVLRAKASGTVTITATSEGKSGTGTVTVR
jgi:hypothetical protein